MATEYYEHNLARRSTVQLICETRYARTRIACSSMNPETMMTATRGKICLPLTVSILSAHSQSHRLRRHHPLVKFPKLKLLFNRSNQRLRQHNQWSEKTAKMDQIAVMAQRFPLRQAGQTGAHNNAAEEAVMRLVVQRQAPRFLKQCLQLRRPLKKLQNQLRNQSQNLQAMLQLRMRHHLLNQPDRNVTRFC
jgi:hypothetical protein